jgi:hypothetical protein
MPAGIADYNRQKAVAYAHKWARSRNPAYYDYDKIGGDCTNFASQCIFAGSNAMNYSRTGGWYYKNGNNKSPSWTGVEFLRNFLVRGDKGQGPVAKEVPMAEVKPGDIIQLSFDGNGFQHSPVCVQVGAVPRPDNILIAAHTVDSDYRPINTYMYQKIRFLHILHVRLW